MHKTKENSDFVGRNNELLRLARFLDDKNGGAVLIAGDRGSGKTTLVNKAISDSLVNDATRKTKLTKHTRSKQIIINIPLIIADNTTTPQTASYYRSMLIRSITRALEADLLTRKYHWLDLPQRWYRSIGYIQSVKRLVPFAKYTSLKKNWGSRFALAKTPIAGALDMATVAELEISDTVLEMSLRNLFSTHSHNHQFLIVIDELDKLSIGNTSNPVNVEEIALLLKNLFNETGIHAFFIADEPALGRIDSKIKREPFCEESTLFKDRLLVNQMPPDDFEKLASAYTNNVDEQTKRKHIASLGLLTRMMPSEFVRFGLLHGDTGDSLVDVQRAQLGSYNYSYRTTMQVFINHVYREYYGKYGQYFDRVLYKSLTKAGDALLDMESKYFLWNNYISLLFTSNLFTDETDERNLKKSTDLSTSSIKSIPELLTQIENLNSDEQSSISFAIGKLIALLDRGGWLSVDEEDGRLLNFQFLGDTFHVENLPTDIESKLMTTTQEKELIKHANYVNEIYSYSQGDDLWSALDVLPVVRNKSELIEYDDSIIHFEYALSIFWKKFENRVKEAKEISTDTFVNKLTRKLGNSYRISKSDTGTITITSGEATAMIFIPVGQPIKVAASSSKTVIIYIEDVPIKNNHNPKVKQIKVDSTVNFDSLIQQIYEIIKSVI